MTATDFMLCATAEIHGIGSSVRAVEINHIGVTRAHLVYRISKKHNVSPNKSVVRPLFVWLFLFFMISVDPISNWLLCLCDNSRDNVTEWYKQNYISGFLDIACFLATLRPKYNWQLLDGSEQIRQFWSVSFFSCRAVLCFDWSTFWCMLRVL